MTASEVITTRRQHLLQFASFCHSLNGTLRKAGLSPEEAVTVMQASISGQCLECAISISGEELAALLQPPATGDANAKARRLRLGDCARPGCESFYYLLSFQAHPKVDWKQLLEQIDGEAAKPGSGEWLRPTRSFFRLLWNSGLPIRVGIALAGIVLALAMRQWYLGGRVWLVHEPQRFIVTPDPAGEHTPKPASQQ
jgi:hypothetical protein